MKKRYLYLMISAIIIALGILFFSIFWPPIDTTSVSGSFTKADKYRQEQVNESDIVLRSELLADTSKIAQTIRDLVQFGNFSISVKNNINQWWKPVLTKYNSAESIKDAIEDLNEYESFIDNNLSTLQNTIEVLTAFYVNNKKPIDNDVESKLKQFYNYVSQFMKRDSIFESTISKIDASIKNDVARKSEVKSLKELRDRIVVDNFFYATSIGDTSKVLYSANQNISYPEKLKSMYQGSYTSRGSFQPYGCCSNVNTFTNNIVTANQNVLPGLVYSKNIGIIVYEQSKLDAILDIELESLIKGRQNIGVTAKPFACYMNTDNSGLGIIYIHNKYDIVVANINKFQSLVIANQLVGLVNNQNSILNFYAL